MEWQEIPELAWLKEAVVQKAERRQMQELSCSIERLQQELPGLEHRRFQTFPLQKSTEIDRNRPFQAPFQLGERPHELPPGRGGASPFPSLQKPLLARLKWSAWTPWSESCRPPRCSWRASRPRSTPRPAWSRPGPATARRVSRRRASAR